MPDAATVTSRHTCPTCGGRLVCPACGGSLTHYRDGAVYVPVMSATPTVGERPRYQLQAAPFLACDGCEWTERTQR